MRMAVVQPMQCNQCNLNSAVNDDEFSETETQLESKYFVFGSQSSGQSSYSIVSLTASWKVIEVELLQSLACRFEVPRTSIKFIANFAVSARGHTGYLYNARVDLIQAPHPLMC